MKRVVVLIIFCATAAHLFGQNRQSSAATTPSAAKKDSKKAKPAPDNSNPLLNGIKGAPTNGPVTTEIYADDAFFDSNKNVGIFSGHVKVADPRFTLQAEKLTVYITKGQNQGLVDALSKMKVAGHIEVTGTLGYDCTYIREIPTATGRRSRHASRRRA